ncbi:MAG: ATP-binding protein [Chloroflexota bacterium]
MTIFTLFNLLALGGFYVITALTLVDFLRYRDRPHLDIALLFSSLVIGLSILQLDVGDSMPAWLDELSSIALAAHPYLLLRLLQHFYPAPRLLRRLALAGLVAVITIMVADWRPWPVLALWAIAFYFVGLEGYVAWAFIRGAITAGGVTRRRLTFAAAGTGLLTTVALLAVVPTLLQVNVWEQLALPVALLVLLAAQSYYFGFAPPRWLRRSWQLVELHRFLQETAEPRANGQSEAVLTLLGQAAIRSVGGLAANVALWDAAQSHFNLHPTSHWPALIGPVVADEGAIGRAWGEKRPLAANTVAELGPEGGRLAAAVRARAMLVVPITAAHANWGLLLVFLRFGSLFATDDLNALALLVEQSGITLAYAALLARQQELTEQLRQQSQAELHDSEERFRVLAEAAFEGICIHENGRIFQANQVFARMYGYDNPDELVGKSVFELVAPASHEAVADHLTTRATDTYEVLGVRQDQSTFPVEVAARDFPYKGRLLRVTTVHDITERKRREQEMRLIQERVMEQERLAAVGQLAAGIAHDFNNIMAVIVLYAQLLQRASGLTAKEQQRLTTIYQQAQHATNLIQQILDFSRRSVMESSPVDLLPFLKELAKLWARTLPENIALDMAHDEKEYVVNGDLTRLQQALMNLVVNARDAMPQGGHIHLTLSRWRLPPGQKHPAPDVEPGEWVRLDVADSGTGIPKEALPHIFEPFFTTKPPGRGTGLGLAQVYGIVKQHGGNVTVASRVGQGTMFTILLPALALPALPAEMVEEPVVATRPATILLVEDNPAACAAMQETLEGLGYRVLVVGDGRAALHLFRQRAGEIDLVLSDVVMPEMGGLALCQALRSEWPDVKMLLMSGYPLTDADRRQMEAGGIELAPKPFTAAQIAGRIQKVLNGAS